MSIHPDFDEPLQTDDSWMTPEQALRVEKIHLETVVNELEAERRMDGANQFDEELRYGIRMCQEKLNQIAEG